MQNKRVNGHAQSNLDVLIELNESKSSVSNSAVKIKFKAGYQTCGLSKVTGLKMKLKNAPAPIKTLRMFAPPLM